MIPQTLYCDVAIIGGGQNGLDATNYLNQNGIDAKHFEAGATAFGRTFDPNPEADKENEAGLKAIAEFSIQRIEQSGTLVRVKGSDIIFAKYVIMPLPDESTKVDPSVDFYLKDPRSRICMTGESASLCLNSMEAAKKVKAVLG